MTFRFTLQRVLELRENAVTQTRLALEEALSKKVKLTEILESEKEIYFKERDDLNLRISQSDFSLISVFERSLDERKNRLMKILSIIREVDVEIRQCQQLFNIAQRELKIIEKLKEKRYLEYQKREADKEARNIDEMATIKYTRALWLQKKKQVNAS